MTSDPSQDNPSSDTPTEPSVAPTESGAQRQSGNDAQLRKVHETAGSDDEMGRGNDVPPEQR